MLNTTEQFQAAVFEHRAEVHQWLRLHPATNAQMGEGRKRPIVGELCDPSAFQTRPGQI